jgi:AcrR family transcriptional regulator
LPPRPQVVFEPRKSPVQARSTASVSSILEATIQVLLDVGKERLTTTRVALRAGVSVGTLYQYFPNKSALLQAVLRNHLESVAGTLERVCQEERDSPLPQIVTRLVDTFLEAKMKVIRTSVALYSVSSDVDGSRITREIGARVNKAIASALATARERAAQGSSTRRFAHSGCNGWSEPQASRIGFTGKTISTAQA